MPTHTLSTASPGAARAVGLQMARTRSASSSLATGSLVRTAVSPATAGASTASGSSWTSSWR